MVTLTLIVTITFVLTLTAVMTWFVRRRAKARSTYRHRAAIIAQLRDGVDKDGPIVGWMVRNEPAPGKPARPVRDLH